MAIDPASIGFWLTRALRFGLKSEGPMEEFGEPVLRLKDPDGIIVKLVGAAGLAATAPWATLDIPEADAIRRIRGATLFAETPEETQAFVEHHFGYRPLARTSAIQRLVSDSGDIIDIRDARGFWASAPGSGTFDHVAFRAETDADIDRVRADLQSDNAWPTASHDRKYFRSLYVREPGRILFELATDKPGMLIDEDEATLGTHLFVPGGTPERRQELTVVLPQFSPPGEPRTLYRDLPFVHRIWTPQAPDGTTLVLLHGSGANEITLLPLANRAAPNATLLALRGRATEEGAPRWFRRLAPDSFDQADIAAEAEALAAFIEEAIPAYDLDPDRLVFLGYSNGANLLNAMLSLHPHLIRRAILLRSMPSLENPPAADMSDVDVLVVSGRDDDFDRYTPPLVDRLTTAGAGVELQTVPLGHGLGTEDETAIREWLARRND